MGREELTFVNMYIYLRLFRRARCATEKENQPLKNEVNRQHFIASKNATYPRVLWLFRSCSHRGIPENSKSPRDWLTATESNRNTKKDLSRNYRTERQGPQRARSSVRTEHRAFKRKLRRNPGVPGSIPGGLAKNAARPTVFP